MQFVKLQKQGPFVSLFYTLTLPIGWEHMLSFAETLISTDLIKKPDNIRLSVAGMAGQPTDVTDQLRSNDYKPCDADFARHETSSLIVEGYSTLMESQLRVCLYNQTDRCLIQVLGEEHFDKYGERCFDKFADSLELAGHLHMERKKHVATWEVGSRTSPKGEEQ